MSRTPRNTKYLYSRTPPDGPLPRQPRVRQLAPLLACSSWQSVRMAARSPSFVGLSIGSNRGDGSYLINQFPQMLGTPSYQIIAPTGHTTSSTPHRTRGLYGKVSSSNYLAPLSEAYQGQIFRIARLHGWLKAYIDPSGSSSWCCAQSQDPIFALQ